MEPKGLRSLANSQKENNYQGGGYAEDLLKADAALLRERRTAIRTIRIATGPLRAARLASSILHCTSNNHTTARR